MAHVTAIAFTLLVYLFLGASYFGWGRIASLFLGLANQRPESSFIPVWLGWAFTLLIFQVLHLFLPITAFSTVPVLAFGALFSISHIRSVIHRFPAKRSSQNLLIASVIIVLGVAVWVAARAMLPPTFYDSGLYHFNTIRWMNNYSIVPGLGNLHGRLAFNHSFFTYVATLNFYPFFGHGRSLANSFLLLLVLATLSPSIISIMRNPSVLIKEHPFRYAADFFMLPIIAYLMLSEYGITDPTPDFASMLLQLIMFSMLVHGIAEWINGQRDQTYRLMILVVLAVTAVTIKLSNLAFSSTIIGFAIAYIGQTSRTHIKNIFRIFLFAAMIIFVWLLRGFILSGAPLYPSTIGYIHVAWAVPIEKVIDEANWVYSFARQPHTHWKNVLGSWAWFQPWLIRISKDNTNVLFPFVFTTLLCITTLVIGRWKKMGRPYCIEWAILLPSIIGLIYWFFTAPSQRFANAIFFLAMICSMLLFLISIKSIARMQMYIAMFSMVFLLCNADIFSYIFRHLDCIKAVSTTGWYPVKEVPLNKKVTLSGLIVYTPITGDQCWDSPLLSTPYFNERLRLRRSENMSAGFTVTRQAKSAENVKQ